jgi:hypothetical protein
LPKPARGGRASTYTPAVGHAICERLMAGESLTAIARDPEMPAYGTILGWVSRHADFEDAYQAARSAQADQVQATPTLLLQIGDAEPYQIHIGFDPGALSEALDDALQG